jgi:hypothetical protein
MTRERMSERELDATLADVGERLAYPHPTRLADAVRLRLREPRTSGHWWDALRSPRYAFAPVFATLAVLALVVVLALPGARAAATEFLHLRGIDIFRAPAIATPSATAIPRATFAGTLTTLDEARRRAEFKVLAPTDPRLGAPDEVYRGFTPTGPHDVITLVYGNRSEIPTSREAGVSALVVEFRGRVDRALFGKVAGSGTRIEELTVNGGSGFWIEGDPHQFFYNDEAGNVWTETLRLAGNTLLWEVGGVTFRLEAQVTREDALRIAASFR